MTNAIPVPPTPSALIALIVSSPMWPGSFTRNSGSASNALAPMVDVTSAILVLPLFFADLPSHVGLDTISAMSALGVGGTGIAFVIYYTLNREIGPTRTSLVAYIAPVFALVYGVTLLDEAFSITTAIGIVLIVGGSWLAAKAPARAPVEAPAARATVGA